MQSRLTSCVLDSGGAGISRSATRRAHTKTALTRDCFVQSDAFLLTEMGDSTVKIHRLVGSVCVAIAVAACSGTAISQEEGPPSQYEHVKGMADFIGFWSGDFQPPNGPEGRLLVFCRWTSNRSYASFGIMMQSGDQRTHIGTTQVGWNGGDKQLNVWGFWPDQQTHGKASLESGKLQIKSKGTTVDGIKTSADVTYTVDGDTLTISVKNRRQGDSEQPDMNIKLERRQRPRRTRDAQ